MRSRAAMRRASKLRSRVSDSSTPRCMATTSAAGSRSRRSRLPRLAVSSSPFAPPCRIRAAGGLAGRLRAAKRAGARGLSRRLRGSGVTVGVLSDSFNCFAVYAAPGSGVPVSGNQGYAPNGFTADYATDQSDRRAARHGRECAPRGRLAPRLRRADPDPVHRRRPGHAAGRVCGCSGCGTFFLLAEHSEADMATGIQALASAGAKVIADDRRIISTNRSFRTD